MYYGINLSEVLTQHAALPSDDITALGDSAFGHGPASDAATALITTVQHQLTQGTRADGRALCLLWARVERWHAATGAPACVPALTARHLQDIRERATSDASFVQTCLDPRGRLGAGIRRIAAESLLAERSNLGATDFTRVTEQILRSTEETT